jgi:hypothetical protein
VEVITPARPRHSEPDTEETVGVGQAGRRIGARGNMELVEEDEVLKRHVAVGSEAGEKAAEQEAEEREHPPG